MRDVTEQDSDQTLVLNIVQYTEYKGRSKQMDHNRF